MVRPATVLFVDHAPALGGAEHSLLLVLKHLDRARWQPHLACAGGPLAVRAEALGIPVHRVPLERLRRSPHAPLELGSGVRAIAHTAREMSAALLIANTVRAAFYVACAARLAHLPWVWHMRDFWLAEAQPRHSWVDRLGKRILARSAARVLANSQAVAAQLPCPEKITVIHNGIEVERYDPLLDGEPFRRRWGIPPGAPLVGMVGRLRPWKGQDRFLRAMAAVAQAMPGAHFAVVGGANFAVADNYPQDLKHLAAGLGLGEQVVFTGHLEDVRPALAALDLYVHPGEPEPFGLTIIEAMAMRKPVVGLAHGALPEIVPHEEAGLLVPPRDEGALARAVSALLADPARRQALGQAGRERVARYFTAGQMAAGVSQALERVAGILL